MKQAFITFLCTLLFLLGASAQEDSIPVQSRGASEQLEDALEQWDGESQIPEEILEEILEEAPVNKANLNDDYDKIYNAALQTAKNEKVLDWAAKQIKNTYIRINDDFKSCPFKLNWTGK